MGTVRRAVRSLRVEAWYIIGMLYFTHSAHAFRSSELAASRICKKEMWYRLRKHVKKHVTHDPVTWLLRSQEKTVFVIPKHEKWASLVDAEIIYALRSGRASAHISYNGEIACMWFWEA